jgi:hypothetical protein
MTSGTNPRYGLQPQRFVRLPALVRVLATLALMCGCYTALSSAQVSPNAPDIGKVEPPNWWVGLTPDLMLLLSGHNLQATKVECNLASLVVGRTRATAGGDYLFVWLRVNGDLRSGTAVCRITTSAGETSFELPLAAQRPSQGKFGGLSQGDGICSVAADRNPGNRASQATAPGKPNTDENLRSCGLRGDLKTIGQHLASIAVNKSTAIALTPIVATASHDDDPYASVDFYAVDPRLGTLRDYQALVDSAHQQGLKVVFDLAVSPVSGEHPWAGKPPMSEWFQIGARLHPDPGRVLGVAKYQRNALDTEDPAVARYLLQNSIWWTESSGFDAIRLVHSDSLPREFRDRWRTGLRRIYPNLTTMTDGDSIEHVPADSER